MSGRNPPSYCTLTLIAMQGHQQKGRQTNTSSNNKDKSNTIIETSTAEDHDDENLHNLSTFRFFFIHDPVIHLLEAPFYRGCVRSAIIAGRKSRNIYIPKYFMGSETAKIF